MSTCTVCRETAAAVNGIMLAKNGRDRFKPAEYMFVLAATSGHEQCMAEAREVGIAELNRALVLAASGGHVECMALAIGRGAQSVNMAMCEAAFSGHPRCMKLAKDRGATQFNNALYMAAYGGQSDCMALAWEWGATNGMLAMNIAAENGHLACMVRLHTWGVCTNPDEIRATLSRAVAQGKGAKALPELLRWYPAGRARALKTTLSAWLAPDQARPDTWPEMFEIMAYEATVKELKERHVDMAGKLMYLTMSHASEAASIIKTYRELESAILLQLSRAERRESHEAIVAASMALYDLRLPHYVLLWLSEWTNPAGLTALKRLTLLQRLAGSIQRVKQKSGTRSEE